MSRDTPPAAADLTADRTLLDAYRRGESWALKVIYEAHVDRVAALVSSGFHFKQGDRTFRFVGVRSRYEAEVLVQDIFSRVLAETTRLYYDGLRPFQAYLMGIARNVCIDAVRAQHARRKKRIAEQQAAPRGSVQAEQWSAVEAAELGDLLSQFIDHLDGRGRTLFERRFRDQKSQQQVAKELAMTRIRLRRMEAKLKRELFQFLRDKGYFLHFKPRPSSLL